MGRTLYLGAVSIAFAAWLVGCSDDSSSDAQPSTAADASDTNHPKDGGDDDAAMPAAGTDPLPPLPDEVALPIVFVHGFAGSAQQFTSQAMRFVANGYPSDRLRAYEHDGAGMAGPSFVEGTDAVVDEARAAFGTDQVFLIGHSRGTSVSSMYLSDPARAAKVAKYIALDGAGCASITVPCIAPAQTVNTRPGQTHPIPGQRHVEVATSKESFAAQFEFLFGKVAKVLDIVKQRAPVEISGRAVNNPANTGLEGAALEIWEVEAETGMRAEEEPLAQLTIDAEGSWGPVTVDADSHYEFVLAPSDSPYRHHIYEQPFLRSSQFVRLRSGPPDSISRMNTNAGEGHVALTVLRMREWTPDDVLEVSTKSESGEQAARNVISEASNNRIAIFLHDDAATPRESSLELLPWFPEQAFQTGVDLFMPGSDEPNGTITLTNLPRGDADKPQVLRVPNWASKNHNITVMFRDFVHE